MRRQQKTEQRRLASVKPAEVYENYSIDLEFMEFRLSDPSSAIDGLVDGSRRQLLK